MSQGEESIVVLRNIYAGDAKQVSVALCNLQKNNKVSCYETITPADGGTYEASAMRGDNVFFVERDISTGESGNAICGRYESNIECTDIITDADITEKFHNNALDIGGDKIFSVTRDISIHDENGVIHKTGVSLCSQHDNTFYCTDIINNNPSWGEPLNIMSSGNVGISDAVPAADAVTGVLAGLPVSAFILSVLVGLSMMAVVIQHEMMKREIKNAIKECAAATKESPNIPPTHSSYSVSSRQSLLCSLV
ncbi:MAG: hypothetical protein FWF23_00940 [Alphaproteobacteria bacterium]|nr:hypothetical protein [Alphaproteobacteria bacterium]MCL2505034.1 hypothetical protein [Alphaproteobacteria bacterium]